jgi:hypothetical protein
MQKEDRVFISNQSWKWRLFQYIYIWQRNDNKNTQRKIKKKRKGKAHGKEAQEFFCINPWHGEIGCYSSWINFGCICRLQNSY